MNLTVILEREPEGGYSAHIPGLRGCLSQGETREEALANIREALELWLESQAEMAREDSVTRETETLSL